MLDLAQNTELYKYATRLAEIVGPYTPSSDDFESHCNSILTVVHCAVANVKKRRNEAISTFCIMPPELVAEVFSWLGPRDLIKATCVSTLWRVTALSFPKLWSVIDFDSSINRAKMLCMFVTRAQQRPLDVRLHDADDYLLDIIFNSESPIRFLDTDYRDPVELGRLQINERGAECLQHLDVRDISISDGVMRPFLHLATLIIRDLETDISGLFSICPNIVTMELYTTCDVTQLPRQPFPTSLKNVFLHGNNDFGEYIQSLAVQPLSTMRFNLAQYDWLAEGNFHKSLNIEEIELDNRRIGHKFSRPHHRVAAVFDRPHDNGLPDIMVLIRATSSSLRRLTLPDDRWDDFLASGINFPLLEHLTLLGTFDDCDVMVKDLVAPRLHTLVLRITGDPCQENLVRFLSLWRRMIRPTGIPLKELVINTTDDAFSLTDIDKFSMSGVADRVQVFKLPEPIFRRQLPHIDSDPSIIYCW